MTEDLGGHNKDVEYVSIPHVGFQQDSGGSETVMETEVNLDNGLNPRTSGVPRQRQWEQPILCNNKKQSDFL